jgi:hypothetical protein
MMNLIGIGMAIFVFDFLHPRTKALKQLAKSTQKLERLAEGEYQDAAIEALAERIQDLTDLFSPEPEPAALAGVPQQITQMWAQVPPVQKQMANMAARMFLGVSIEDALKDPAKFAELVQKIGPYLPKGMLQGQPQPVQQTPPLPVEYRGIPYDPSKREG